MLQQRFLQLFEVAFLLNNIKNTVVVEKACANREGTVTFNLAAQLGWSTAINVNSSLQVSEKIEVHLYVLDGIIKEESLQDKIGLIKIIVEGYSLMLFWCKRLSAKRKPLL